MFPSSCSPLGSPSSLKNWCRWSEKSRRSTTGRRPTLDFVAFRLFDTTDTAYRMFMLLTAVAMFAALLTLLTRTRVGLIIQAALTHPDMVAMLGHDVP